MEIREYLLTWEAYNRKDFDVPYVFKIQKDKQVLIYFGANHTNNKNDPMFSKLDDQWNEFLKNENKKKIVFLEGGHGKDKYIDLEQAIERHGEAGYVCHKANLQNIEIISPEPDTKYLMNQLANKYSKDKVIYNFAAAIFLQFNRQITKPNPKEYFERFMKRDCEVVGWKIYSYEDLKEIHKNIFGTEFDPNDENHFYKNVAPNEFNSVINEISREEDIYRDISVIEKTIEYWKRGYSIFITYGSGHAVIQEPALLEYLK